MKTPVISIIGRPNVGKSTIFNRLLGNSMKAITHNRPGVTRDRHYGIYKYTDENYEDKDLILVDTGGFYPDLETIDDDKLYSVMAEQARIAVKESDLVLIVMDVRDGLLPFDESIVQFTRKEKKDFWILVNKYDDDRLAGIESDFYKYASEGISLVSAEHNRGLSDLKERISTFAKEFTTDQEKLFEGVKPNFQIGGRISIIGAPNVGKSTLLNHLIGSERASVSSIAGTTIDPIEGFIDLDFGQEVKYLKTSQFNFKKDEISLFQKVIEEGEGFIDTKEFDGADFFYEQSEISQDEIEEDSDELLVLEAQEEDIIKESIEEELIEDTIRSLKIIDTAGIRRKSQVNDFIETQSVYRSLRAINESDVVIYMVDGVLGLTSQDKKLMGIAIERGKTLVIAINKIDLKEEVYSDKKEKKEFLLDFEYELPWLKYCRPVFISAKTGWGMKGLKQSIQEGLIYRNKSIPTGELNRVIHQLVERNPTVIRGRGGAREFKFKYAAMVKSDPPTFLLFVNRSRGVPMQFRRYLVNGIRRNFPIPNTPIHLVFRTGKGDLTKLS